MSLTAGDGVQNDSGTSPAVCAVIVTYNQRWQLLDRVLDALARQTVPLRTVVVVDNGSPGSAMFNTHAHPHIELIRLDANYGSACGFKTGMQWACEETQSELIWLLDDDNVPEATALESLLQARRSLGGGEDHCFASFRADRKKYQDALRSSSALTIQRNSFMGFTVFSYIKYLASRRGARVEPAQPTSRHQPKAVEYCIYGGLLIPISLIRRVGFPDERFFVYMDDTEYTTRITRNDASIYMVPSSVIRDIDLSWNRNETKHLTRIADSESSATKAYYITRNNVYFHKQYGVSNKYYYFFNIFCFLIAAFSVGLLANRSIKATKDRFFLILRAIGDGWNARMGVASDLEA
jgi:GT2 family glycosyltransferase